MNNKYSSLLKGLWQDTFDQIYKSVKCTPEHATQLNDMDTGLEKYLPERGFNNSSVIVKFHGSNLENELKEYLDTKKEPCFFGHKIIHIIIHIVCLLLVMLDICTSQMEFHLMLHMYVWLIAGMKEQIDMRVLNIIVEW